MSFSSKSRIFYGIPRSKIILVTFLLFSVIVSITSAVYYFNTVSLSDNDVASDSPFAGVLLQIQEFVNFSSLFVISDTFGEDLLKAVISLFVVVNPVGKVPLFVTLTEKMEIQKQKIGFEKCDYYYCSIAYNLRSSWYSGTLYLWN